MKIIPTPLPGVKLIEPDVFADERGFFMESWNHQRYADAGLDIQFSQSNVSRSSGGVLRGLHFQNPNPQGKLVFVLEGEVFDVAVDIRVGSPSFGRWHGEYLSAQNRRQYYVPPGFAHGFAVTSESALFCYFCTTAYDAQADSGIAWNDDAIGVRWPIDTPQLSTKDRAAPLLADHPNLPKYEQ